MTGWPYTLALDADDASTPLFLQIARGISDDVRRGRLRPGDQLPGSRTLASALGVHRNTVLVAYGELEAEGWLTSEAVRGTFISSTLPDLAPRRFAATMTMRRQMPRQTGFPLGAPPIVVRAPQPSSGLLVFRASAPDARLVPFAALGRAYRRALQLHGPALLTYREPEGHPRLRAALADMMTKTRGLAAAPDSVFITRGSQMALHLTARALLVAGDRVAIESLGYRHAHEAFRSAGAELVPVAVDQHGLDVPELTTLHARRPIRAVYVTSHHQYPTTVSLSPGRRLELLAFARQERIAVIEDDYDHEFHYDGRPILPLASADQGGVVIYIGTLSKVLAPGVRLGYVVAPQPFVDRLAAHRASVDMHGDHAIEYAVAELIEDGELQRHVRRTRREYGERRATLVAALRRRLPHAVSFSIPSGGTGIWAKVLGGVDVEEWSARAQVSGVAFETAKSFTFDDEPRPFMRLGFAALNRLELDEATRRLAAALPPPTLRGRSAC